MKSKSLTLVDVVVGLVAIVIVIMGVVAGASWLTQFLWNSMIMAGSPDMHITFWQSFGGWLLASIVIGALRR